MNLDIVNITFCITIQSFIVIFSTAEARKKEKLSWRSKAMFKLQQFKKAEQPTWDLSFALPVLLVSFFNPTYSPWNSSFW